MTQTLFLFAPLTVFPALLTSQKYFFIWNWHQLTVFDTLQFRLFCINSALQVYVVKCKRYDKRTLRGQTGQQTGKLRLWRAEQQRESQSGWQACSRADHRKAGRQEAWGGRLQREQTAGMLNYHTSVHDMSTPLTTARRLYPVQSRVRLRPRWFLLWLSVICLVPPLFKPERDGDNLPHVMVILSFYLIRDQSVLRGLTSATENSLGNLLWLFNCSFVLLIAG